MANWNFGIRLVCLFNIANLPAYEATASTISNIYGGFVYSSGMTSMDLESSEYDNIVVLPESHGDIDYFYRLFQNSFREIYGESIAVRSWAWVLSCLRTESAAFDVTLLRFKKVLFVQMGNNIDHDKRVLMVISKIHTCTGWDVRVLLSMDDVSAYWRKAISQQTWNHIAMQYGLFLRVGSGTELTSASALYANSDLASVEPHHTHMEGPAQGIRRFLTETPINQVRTHFLEEGPLGTSTFSSTNLHYVCRNLLPRVLFTFDVARIVIGQSSEPSVKCDNRLVFTGSPKSNPTSLLINVAEPAIIFSVTNEAKTPMLAAPAMPLFRSMNIDATTLSKIIVISDLHGDYEHGVSSLCIGIRNTIRPELDCNEFFIEVNARLMGIMSTGESLHPAIFVEPRVLVVQMGDLVDRGPQSRKLYLLFDRMKAIVGIDCVALMGNHELIQHLDSENNFPAYYEPEVREKVYGETAESRFAEFRSGPIWDLIFTNHVAAIKIGTTLFVHGGMEMTWLHRISDEIGNLFTADGTVDVDRLNYVVRHIMATHGPDSVDDFLGIGSPMWSRELTTSVENDHLCTLVLGPLLETFQVDRIIVGHTPQQDGLAKTRCEGRVVLTDVAISRWMRPSNNAQPSAVVLDLDAEFTITAHYAAEQMQPPRQQLFPATGPAPQCINGALTGPLVLDAVALYHHEVLPRVEGGRSMVHPDLIKDFDMYSRAPGAPVKPPRKRGRISALDPDKVANTMAVFDDQNDENDEPDA